MRVLRQEVESEQTHWSDPNVERFLEITAQVIRRRRAEAEKAAA